MSESGTGADAPACEEAVVGGPSLRFDLRVDDPRWAAIEPIALCERLAHLLADRVGAPAEADVLFCDDATVRDLNQRFRGKDAPTNVLAFPSAALERSGAPTHLGGIVLAFETTRGEADAWGIPLVDHATHLTLHGFLHLLGHDHVEEGERLAMERLEIVLLGRLGIADPYEGE